MSLGQADVKKIALLAALAVEEDELAIVGDKLSNILDLFAQLEAANTDGIEPMAHPLDKVQRLRDDLVTEIDQHEKFQAIAPAVEADLYLVPKVIE